MLPGAFSALLFLCLLPAPFVAEYSMGLGGPRVTCGALFLGPRSGMTWLRYVHLRCRATHGLFDPAFAGLFVKLFFRVRFLLNYLQPAIIEILLVLNPFSSPQSRSIALL